MARKANYRSVVRYRTCPNPGGRVIATKKSPSRILVLSFYYPPDLSAGSFRAAAVVKALRRVRSSCEIDVVTTTPNRYRSYRPRARRQEELEGVRIFRMPVPSHRSAMWDQAIAFVVFACRALSIVYGRRYDLVFATSARMFTSLLGAVIAKAKGVPFYNDIQDVFPEDVEQVLGQRTGRLIMPCLKHIERFTVMSATTVSLVSSGLLDYYQSQFSGTRIVVSPNGVEREFLGLSKMTDHGALEGRLLRIVYAGNVGQCQGLHLILPQLASSLSDVCEIVVIGDGGARVLLEKTLVERSVKNVRLLPPMCRSQLIDCYETADILFLHLNRFPTLERVLPSKLFEYAATGKPIVAGVSGEASRFIKAEIDNAAIFPPCDATNGLRAVNEIDLSRRDRSKFAERFDGERLMNALARDVVGRLGSSSLAPPQS